LEEKIYELDRTSQELERAAEVIEETKDKLEQTMSELDQTSLELERTIEKIATAKSQIAVVSNAEHPINREQTGVVSEVREYTETQIWTQSETKQQLILKSILTRVTKTTSSNKYSKI
jgi:hypothetical protein